MRLAAPLGALLALLIGPLMLAEAGGWTGQRSFAEELGSTLGISALGVLAIVLILPTRLRVLARLGADAAVRLHRHLVGVLLALIVGHVALAVALQPARYQLLRFFGAGDGMATQRTRTDPTAQGGCRRRPGGPPGRASRWVGSPARARAGASGAGRRPRGGRLHTGRPGPSLARPLEGAATASERARCGVTRAIRQAMARIGEHHPQLGEA